MKDNKNKKKKRKNSKQFNQQFRKRFITRRAGLIWIFTFIILFVMLLGGIRIEKRVSSYQKIIQELSLEVDELKKNNDSLEEQMNNMGTDEYIEKIARERLGMVKKGEYTLKESDDTEQNTFEKKDTKKE